MRNYLKHIGLIAFGFMLALFVRAQDSIEPELKIKVEKSPILIGEQTKLHLSLKYEGNQEEIDVIWPEYHDTIIEAIEVISSEEIKTSVPDKNAPYAMLKEQNLVITCFDSGYYAIPPFQVIINTDTILSNALLFEVNTVEVDTAKGIADIKGIFDEPYTTQDAVQDVLSWFKENWMWVVLGIIIVVAIISAIIYIRRREQGVKEKFEGPKLPPHENAYQRLESLSQKKLWQQGKVKEYYIELSDTIRLYLEDRYKINALELTTDEILQNLQFINLSDETKKILTEILRLSDLVKFAKQKPDTTENELSMVNSFKFVDETKLIEEVTQMMEENKAS